MLPVNALTSPGGVKPSIRLSCEASNGFCGVISGAKTAARIITAATTAETIVTGERRKE